MREGQQAGLPESRGRSWTAGSSAMATLCPDSPTLQCLLLGQLADPDGERWEAHLERCPTCIATAASLTVLDSLGREVRQAAAGPPVLIIPPAELPVIDTLAERARSLCRSSGPADSA